MPLRFVTDGSVVVTGEDAKALCEYVSASIRYDAAEQEVARCVTECDRADEALTAANRAYEEAGKQRRLAREKLEALPQFKDEVRR